MTSSLPPPPQNWNELPEAKQKETDYHRRSELEKVSELLYKLREIFWLYFENGTNIFLQYSDPSVLF